MSTYTEWSNTIPLAPGMTAIGAARLLAGIIGEQAQRTYFPLSTVIREPESTRLDLIEIAMDAIPPDGCDITMVERALQALAPHLHPDLRAIEIVMVHGMHWGDASMYRLSRAGLEVTSATFVANGPWRPVEHHA